MFAVPGWSVSADALQAEQAPSAASRPTGASSKKRKRAGGASATESVTASNVIDLYEAVVEGRGKTGDGGKRVRAAKKQRGDADAKRGDKKEVKRDETRSSDKDGAQHELKNEAKGKKDKKKQKQRDDKKRQSPAPGREDAQESNKAPAPNTDTVAKTSQPPKPPKPAKLTPLQASMREKLISARFRHLNETLYTRPSGEAFTLFQESPEMFDEYHEGFRRQVKVWPENPVDSLLEDIRARARIKPPHGKGRPGAPPALRARTPLPRTAGTCIIADLGCGDARLAESLQADKAKLRLDVRSYDLQSPSPLVTKADIANLPLEDGSVNVAIFCLALMGTNWLDFVEEAYRVLHWKGELWIAEIKSRFGPVRKKNAPVDHSVGNRKRAVGKKAKGARDGEGDAADGEDLAVEIDGAEDLRRQTDVSAFVEALRKRGFVSHGDRGEAVDMSNRMFVKMHFIKGAAPTKGKGVKPQEAPRPTKGAALKWTADKNDDDGEKEGSGEAAILKPCVYKIR
ncbi:putative methyltransferase [Hirsutella rhossiliensis]|uniref:Ribosomal RNA-processing protein 8 n=1 Tax=Hirsutella rhossiliensis TaxID=111463 RepID=A0A9P8SK86_9HYPO|nr:putative methyltransferase domain-containing protein [Hirsutella rhossiliensis]KAH0965671.1 putative methyltransferase domain-containing protein [Hirsutella rhossiliensis]